MDNRLLLLVLCTPLPLIALVVVLCRAWRVDRRDRRAERGDRAAPVKRYHPPGRGRSTRSRSRTA